MPLRPAQLEIATDDPFLYDLLKRQPAVEAFANLVVAEPGPAVIALNGGFGSGKSTFLAMLTEHLRSQERLVATFNAWQQHHTPSPLVDLVAALSDDLAASSKIRQRLRAVGRTATAVGFSLVNAASRGLVSRETFAPKAQHSQVEAWKSTEMLRQRFHAALSRLIDDLDSGIVVVVDELDRCMPQHALVTLDVIRHLFDVEGIVVVLGVNQDELRERVRWLYGEDCDAATYLGRFIDLSIDVPKPDRTGLQAVAASATPANPNGAALHNVVDSPAATAAAYAEQFGLGLRELQQATVRVVNVLDRFRNPVPQLQVSPAARQHWNELAGLMCALRIADHDLYRRFFHEPSDPVAAAADLIKKFPTIGSVSSRAVMTLLVLALGDEGLQDEGLPGLLVTTSLTQTMDDAASVQAILQGWRSKVPFFDEPALSLPDLVELVA